MCGDPITQADFMYRVENPSSTYKLLGTYYNQSGDKAIMVTDGDLPEMEYVYNVYSLDGRDYQLSTPVYGIPREQAAELMAARGFTYTSDPTVKPKRAALPKRQAKPAPLNNVQVQVAEAAAHESEETPAMIAAVPNADLIGIG